MSGLSQAAINTEYLTSLTVWIGTMLYYVIIQSIIQHGIDFQKFSNDCLAFGV